MSAVRGGTAVAVWAAVTSWLVLASWSRLVEYAEGYAGRLFLAVALVTGVGVGLRRLGLEWPFAFSGQLLTALLVLQAQLGTSWLPTTHSTRHALLAVMHAVDSAARNPSPVPSDATTIVPLLLAGAVAVHLVVDLVAVTLGRVLPASLPLLAAWVLPVSVLGSTSGWAWFLIAAAAWLTLVAAHEDVERGRWGQVVAREWFTSLRPGRSALLVGGAALLTAALLPGALPHRAPYRFDGGGPGTGSVVRVADPIADLQRNLVRGADVDLLRVTLRGEAPPPTYVRLSVLDEFDGEAWHVGARSWPPGNAANGALPSTPALSLPGTRVSWRVAVSDAFASDWLPLPRWTVSALAGDDWRYDSVQLDVHRAGHPGTTAGMKYALTEFRPEIDPALLQRAPRDPEQVAAYTSLPADRPAWVRRTAEEMTRGATTDYERAVALQQYFQRNFTYSIATQPGTGFAALESFLDEKTGRSGYCEQFAASMALLARELGMPARVSVGFLNPRRVDGSTFEFSAHDLHAWPEIWFSGVGWVGFEPTPTSHTGSVPAWTRPPREATPTTSASPTATPSATPRPRDRTPDEAPTATASATRPWRAPLLAGGVLVVLVAATVTPRLLRRRQRSRRLRSGEVESWWDELRAETVDLGHTWPAGRSPRATARILHSRFGPEQAEQARPALDRLVTTLEVRRYAPDGSGPATAADAEVCAAALRAGSSRRAVRLATWWPRSALRRRH